MTTTGSERATIDLTQVRGVPECTLTPQILDLLPAQNAPAPWRAHAKGMFWWAKPDDAAVAALREILPPGIDPTLRPAFVAAALISYIDTPVGAYHEILAIVSLRRGRKVVSHVPFIAVDSAASVVGGRANWALPKTLIDFEGEPASGTTMTARGADWVVTATPHASGPPLPFASPRMNGLVQFGPGDDAWRAKSSGRGVVRLGHVDVSVASEGSLASWLPSGRCRGVVASSMHGWMGPSVVGAARSR